MKKIKYILFPILISTLLFSSACDNILEEKPESFVNKNQFYKNKAQCIAALNSCYNALNDIFRNGLFTVSEACSDLALLKSTDINARFEISPANPGIGAGIWTDTYNGIMKCNAVIDGIKGAPLDDKTIKSLIAEAVTLRSLYYYVLTAMFNDVPFYTEDISNLEILEKISKLGRMDATQIRNSLIKELQEYAPALPAKRPSDIEGNRASGPLAYMVIAKMAMWNKQFDVALEALQEIQKVYGDLSQYELKDTYFRYKNTPESILEVQYTWSVSGLKKTTTVACICTPTKQTNTDIYDGISIPELGSKANPFVSILPSDHLIALYKENENDPREDIIMARSYNGQWFKRPSTNNFEGKPWMGPKFWCPGMDNMADGNNQKVFRYAEALLMIAECANEVGNTTLAMEALNEIKKRATIPTLDSYPGKEAFFNEMKNEKGRELMGEYGRKWDLVRWGIYYKTIKETTAKEYDIIDNNIREYHEYYPIPDTEVFRSGGVLTNDAYNK